MPQLTNEFYIPYKRNLLPSYLSENKTPLLIGLTVGVLLSSPILITCGAVIYHSITEAGLARCFSNHTSWEWATTTL